MSFSVYPVFEREVEGYDVTAINGKPLAWAVNKHTAKVVEALQDFYSVSPIELADMAGLLNDWDGEGEPDLSAHNFPPEEWFEVPAGLVAVRDALNAVKADPLGVVVRGKGDVIRNEWVIRDLEDIERALLLAEPSGTRFHFAVDV